MSMDPRQRPNWKQCAWRETTGTDKSELHLRFKRFPFAVLLSLYLPLACHVTIAA